MPTLAASAKRDWAARLDTWFRPVTPAARLGAIRVLVGGFALVYLLARFVHLWRVSRFSAAQFRPVGALSLLDAPLSPSMWHALLIATTLLGLAFFLGFRHRALGPVFALGLLVTLSYRNSFGMIFHTENLLVLHVIVLAFAPAADAWSLDARRRGVARADSWRYGWPIFLMCAIAVIAYFLAGVAKLRYGGIAWGSGDVLRNYVAMDNMRKLLLGDTYSPLAGPSMQLGAVFTLLATGSLLLEVLAPISLVSRRFARAWVPSMVAFHLGIVALMAIVFPYPISGIAFVCFYRAEVLLDRVVARLRSLRSHRKR